MLPSRWLALAAVLLAFAVGAIDDARPGGLGPVAKLAGQSLAALPLAAWAGGGLEGALLAVAAVAAQNVLNTFDHADGNTGAVAALGLAFVSPIAAALVLGVLVFNLDGRRRARDPSGAPDGDRDAPEPGADAPTAYWGDAGAFLLAIVLLLDPAGWAALWIPALDLARVSVERVRSGGRPWVGDRRHVAHRLQRRGVPTWGIVLVVLGLAAPGCVLPLLTGAPWALPVGLGLGFVLYLMVIRASRDPGRAG